MAAPTQLIFTDNPGAIPASYTVPPSLALVVSSIFARFNGAGAGGDFVPTLDILSQSGQLMARVAVSQTLSAGDSARVTWAPFLRRQAAAAAATSTVPWLQFSVASQALLNTGTLAAFDNAYAPTGQTGLEVGGGGGNGTHGAGVSPPFVPYIAEAGFYEWEISPRKASPASTYFQIADILTGVPYPAGVTANESNSAGTSAFVVSAATDTRLIHRGFLFVDSTAVAAPIVINWRLTPLTSETWTSIVATVWKIAGTPSLTYTHYT